MFNWTERPKWRVGQIAGSHFGRTMPATITSLWRKGTIFSAMGPLLVGLRQSVASSTRAISSAAKPYRSYTSRSISASVASIWRCIMAFRAADFATASCCVIRASNRPVSPRGHRPRLSPHISKVGQYRAEKSTPRCQDYRGAVWNTRAV